MPTQKQVDDAQRSLGKRIRAYSACFAGATEVLEDLAKFCRANESCFHEDPRVHAALEGRREVWLRIQQHLNLTDEQLFALYAPPKLVIVKEAIDG